MGHIRGAVAAAGTWAPPGIAEVAGWEMRLTDPDYISPPLLPMECVRHCRVLPDRGHILRYLPKDIVFAEVGVALGDFTALVLQTCAVRHFLGIDIFTMHQYPDSWGGRVGEALGELDHVSFYRRRFAAEIDAGRLTVLQGDSRQCLAELANQSVDVFYVDASHHYESVRDELALVRQKLVPGGLIILNDYTMFDQFRLMPYGVVRATNEFMIEHRWEMVFFALHQDMFCDVVLRELPRQTGATAALEGAKPRELTTSAKITAAADGGPTIVSLPDPALGRIAREILALLRPMEALETRLVRRGRDHDGGYIMLDGTVSGAVVYSLGVNDDVSWDMDMAAVGCDVFQYDHTISELPAWHPKFHFFRTGIAAKSSSDGSFRSIDDLIKINGHSGRRDLILKMDIEGSEWEVIAALRDVTLESFSQILVELHGFATIDRPDRRQAILSGLRRLVATHQVVHVHANNFGWLGIVGGVMLPDTLEVTFVRRGDHRFGECLRSFPTELDMPCDPNAAEYVLGYLGRGNA